MKPVLFILLLLSSLNAAAADFSVVIHKPFDSALFDVTEDYDRTISAVGFTKNYKTNAKTSQTYTNAFDYLASQSDRYGYHMQLVKINAKAKILLSKTAALKEFSTAVSVQKTPTNGYFIGGYTMNGALILVKLDANGNLLYFKKFGTKNFDKMNSLIALRDGGVLSVGFSVTSRDIHDDMFKTGLGNDDIFITRFSKNGQMLWSKKYGTSHDDRGISAAEANDGSIVVLATTQYDKNKDITLMRLGENGDKIWLKHFKSTKLIEAKKIIRLRDGNFVIALVTYDDFAKAQVRLIKFDLYKNIIHDETVQTRYASLLNDIAEFSNGKIIGVGYVKDRFNTDGLAMIFDSHLKLLNQEHYGNKNYDEFKALHILDNSQVAVVGLYTDKDSQEENMWIVKLNSDASMAQLALSTDGFYKQLCQLFVNEIDKKEITITQDLNIKLTGANLYFKAGAYRLTQAQKDFLEHFSKKLLPFLRKHQNQVATLEINGYTSSEWQKSDFKARYLKNANLSLKRSYETLAYIFTKQDAQTQHYLTNILKSSGSSYRDAIMINGSEDKERSRRVSFKILLR